jgi:uncharacterized repeat protein (TIGR04042 family)
MPAMHYTIRWPDASESLCYSPSLIIQDYFAPDRDYPLAEFLTKLREATAIANDRVRAKFGFACSRAGDQLATLEQRAQTFAASPNAAVRMLGFGPADA